MIGQKSKAILSDLIAGLTTALAAIPDGIAGVLPPKMIDRSAIFSKSAFRECPLPRQLPSNQVTLILPYEDLCKVEEADFERELPILCL